MKRLRYQNGTLDAIDARILDALVRDARSSVAELARMVAPVRAERVRADRSLEAAGVIEGCTLAVNPKALGLPIAAWLRIRPVPGQLQQVAEILQELPEIVECDRITGEDCFIARIHVRSIEDLERLIDRVIPYAMTNSSIMQSSPVKRCLPAIFRDDRR